jgi:hypothetical protein
MLNNDGSKLDNYFTLRGSQYNELETDPLSKIGIDSMRSQFSCYDKERDEEIENKNLFAYELYENTDLLCDDEAKKIDEKCSSGYNSIRGNEKLRGSFNSTKNLVSKKTTSNTHCREKDAELNQALKHLNIVNLDVNENLPGRNFVLIENKMSKENLLKQILAMNFNNDRKAKSVSSTFSRRPKSTEASVMFGERLYHKGLALKERSSKNLMSIRAQRNNKEMRECTFTPKLNNTSILCNLKATYSLGDSNSHFKPRPKVSSYLTKDNSNLNSKLSFLKNIEVFDINKVANRSRRVNGTTKDTNEKDNTTILRDSKYMTTSNFNSRTYDSMKSRKKSTDEIMQHTQKLYNDAEKYRMNKENIRNNYYSEKCTFQPNIMDKDKPNVYNFFYRLQRWVDKRNEKYEFDLEKVNYDSKTGLRLFSPQINTRSSLSKVGGTFFKSLN